VLAVSALSAEGDEAAVHDEVELEKSKLKTKGFRDIQRKINPKMTKRQRQEHNANGRDISEQEQSKSAAGQKTKQQL